MSSGLNTCILVPNRQNLSLYKSIRRLWKTQHIGFYLFLLLYLHIRTMVLVDFYYDGKWTDIFLVGYIDICSVLHGD